MDKRLEPRYTWLVMGLGHSYWWEDRHQWVSALDPVSIDDRSPGVRLVERLIETGKHGHHAGLFLPEGW